MLFPSFSTPFKARRNTNTTPYLLNNLVGRRFHPGAPFYVENMQCPYDSSGKLSLQTSFGHMVTFDDPAPAPALSEVYKNALLYPAWYFKFFVPYNPARATSFAPVPPTQRY